MFVHHAVVGVPVSHFIESSVTACFYTFEVMTPVVFPDAMYTYIESMFSWFFLVFNTLNVCCNINLVVFV